MLDRSRRRLFRTWMTMTTRKRKRKRPLRRGARARGTSTHRILFHFGLTNGTDRAPAPEPAGNTTFDSIMDSEEEEEEEVFSIVVRGDE